MAVVGPRHPFKQDHHVGRGFAAGLVARVGEHLVAHSAAYAVGVSLVSVAWGLQQVG
ncbi:MAG TPA: hypothetical protein VGM33_10950 [Baekduia sp.]|jgi:hypothetical protein